MSEVVCLFMFVGLLIIIMYLLDKVTCKRLHDTLVVVGVNLNRKQKYGISEVMSELGQGAEGGQILEVTPDKKESSFSSGGTDPLKAPLSILIKITKVDGESLPYGEVSVGLIEEIFQNSVGVTPLEVLILNDQDALVDLTDGMAITEIAMAVHGEGRWRDQDMSGVCHHRKRKSDFY